MKSLKKPTKAKNCPHKKRMEDICAEVRKILHIDDWRYNYFFAKKPEDNSDSSAQCFQYDKNERITIGFYDCFFDYEEVEVQLKVIIHEHLHAIMTPFMQINKNITRTQSEDTIFFVRNWHSTVEERVVDHLESVIYDLIKDDF